MEIEFEMVFFYGGDSRIEHFHGVDESGGVIDGVDGGEYGATTSEGYVVRLARINDKSGVVYARQREGEGGCVCRFSKGQGERGDALLTI